MSALSPYDERVTGRDDSERSEVRRDEPRAAADQRTGDWRNDLSGSAAGNVLQGRDFSGPITFFSTAPNRPPIPRQLKLAPRVYVDRAEEHAHLSRLLDEDAGPLLVLLTGLGGVGKSTTGTKWLHEVAGRFPDGQLYGDLGGGRPGVGRSATDVLKAWLIALGVAPEAVPATEAERRAEYRSRTADRRIAVLVDDAESAGQVSSLRPTSPDSVMVVTSHRRLGGLVAARDAVPLPLRPLDPEYGVALLERLLGEDRVAAEPAAALRLADLCDGLPMALRTAAYLWGTGRWPTVGELVEDLSDERTRWELMRMDGEPSVSAAFELTYDGLPEEARQLLLDLGAHPGPEFGSELVEHLDGRRELAALVGAGFVTDDTEKRPHRWRLHSLAHHYARTKAEADRARRDATERGIVDWYLRRATAADRTRSGRWRISTVGLDEALFPDADAAAAWFDAEHATLRAAVDVAAERGWHDTVWQLCEALWGLYFHTNDFTDWLHTHEQGVAAAVASGNQSAEARIRLQLGFAYYNQGDFDQALTEFTGARPAAEQSGRANVLAATLESVGLAHLHLHEPEPALAAFEQTRALVEIDPDSGDRAVANIWRHRSTALGEAGRYEQALDGLRTKAIPGYEKVDDAYNVARALTSVGDFLIRSGQPAPAVPELRRALSIFSAVRNQLQAAEAFTVLARAYDELNDRTEAEACLVEAESVYARLGSGHVRDVRARLAEIRARS
jgi:tetratricopeptide (TPR) repeat protein